METKDAMIRKRTTGFAVGIACSVALACGGNKPAPTITINNPLSIDRHELVSIPYQRFADAFGVDSLFRVLDADSGTEVAYQLETRGEPMPQQILLYVAVPASGRIRLHVAAERPEEVKAKTYARYVPERYDDFAWENDVVAFRMYGKALEGRPDDAQGMDLWSKRTTGLVVDKWYAHGDYHTDHGEGMDYYSVGQTLGAGDIAPFVHDTVVFSKHYREYAILDNGPLRTTFRLTYEPWLVDGKSVAVVKQFTLDAGSQLNRVEVIYAIEGNGRLPVAIGIAKRQQPGSLLQEQRKGLFGYWEPEIGDYGITGVGVMLDGGGFSGFGELSNQYLAFAEAGDGAPFTYFVGGAWNRAGTHTTAESWFAYLEQFRERQAKPLIVEIN